MHFDARPAWRYQWLAVVGIGAMLGAMVLTQLYGPLYLGLRLTHLVSSAAGAMALYFLLLLLYRHLAWRFIIDDNNIESYQGVLARHVRSIRIDNLRNITVNQTVVQRLLGVGDVEFSGAAGSDVEVVFFGVSDPMRIKQLAQRVRDETVTTAQ